MAPTHTISTQSVALASEQGAPEWVQLTPQGPVLNARDGRVFTLPDPERVVRAFIENGAHLPIDVEHATEIRPEQGLEAPAYGWIEEVEARDGALWGRVSWTAQGEEWVTGKAYRYLSPTFFYDKETLEMLSLLSAALTNQPAFKMKALARNNPDNEQEQTGMSEKILAALGLASGATDDDAVKAVASLKTSADTPDPAKFVPRADHDAALARISEFETADKDRAEAEITAAVDDAIEAGKITPAARDFHVAACRANGVDAFRTMVADMPVIAGGQSPKLKGGDDQQPGGLTDEEIATCRQLRITPEDFAKTKAAQAAKETF